MAFVLPDASEIGQNRILAADAETGQPVTAAVYVDGERVRKSVTQVDLTVNLATDRLTEIRVEAPSYYPWDVAARGGTHRMKGPIQLIPIELAAPAGREA